MVGLGSCAGTLVDSDVDMNEDSIIGPERVLPTTPGVYIGEAPAQWLRSTSASSEQEAALTFLSTPEFTAAASCLSLRRSAAESK